MQNNYCLPIIKNSKAKVISDIKSNQSNYSFFEIWLDYIDDLSPDFLSDLLRNYKNRLVFVFRRKNLDKPALSTQEQLKIIKTLENKECLVDMDVYDQSELIRSTANRNLKTIISYHNYEQTPDENKLRKIIDDIKLHNPEIIKVSTFCKNKTDSLVLLKIMLEMKAQGKKHIILGMGEHGLITRLYGALWGNELTFITEKKQDSSAPGQMTRLEFEKFLKDQGIKNGG